MFDFERFVEECKEAARTDDPRDVINELVTKAVESPSALLAAIGEPQEAGIHRIHVAEDLTILNLVWGPEMNLYPHNHNMWACIGLYGGREDNTFYQRTDDGLAKHGTRVVEPGDVARLGPEAIHSVRNPLPHLTGALHVYGGNFFEAHRSEWTPDTFEEQPYSVEGAIALFAESNERWKSIQTAQKA
jgi:predicted metal-dependent enzyme (double-stranded beta helix superfamily)